DHLHPAGAVKQFVTFRESGIERRPNLWNDKMGMHRGGIGEARYAYAPGRSSTVFCLGRMGLWNGDRDCEPAQLIVAAPMGEQGREAPPGPDARTPAPVAPRGGFATRLGSRGFSLIEAEADWGKADMGTHFICRVAMEQPRPSKPPPPPPAA